MCLVSLVEFELSCGRLTSQWDYALNHFQMANYKGALDCFSILKDESNWSRAVYT
jgi:hypothetical protein